MEHFGNYVRRLREVRGMTQEELAERSKLASDTIRRLERESFSPSLKTLRKLCAGLGITLSTLFNGFELPTTDTGLNDLIALLRSASPRTLQIIIRVVRELIRLLDD